MTVRNWSVRGWLSAEFTAGGHRRYPVQEIERFARERGLTLQLEEDEKERVLIVDDDETFGNFLLAALEEFPDAVEARVARDGFEAGHLLHIFRPTVVLLDLVMPGVDGFQVCQYIKESPPTRTVRVMAMTGHTDEGYEERIVSLGAERCLSKPIAVAHLLTLLNIVDPYPSPLEAEQTARGPTAR